MKALLLFTLSLFFAAAHARAQAPAAAPANAAGVRVEAPKSFGEGITGRELEDLDGRAFRLSDYAGRVYVVNLWATWCAPCRLEIPGLNRVYEEFRGRGVEFVGLTTEDPSADGAKVRAFARELPVKYRVGWLDGETAEALMRWNAPPAASARRFALPQTFVIGKDGHVVLHVRGYNPAVPDMIRAGVEKALGPAPAAPAPAAPPASETSPSPGT